jgi:hypothetical protein
MASCMTDDLGEFFDFDQLDRDHGAGSLNHFEDHMAIGWAANDHLSIPTQYSFQPHNNHDQAGFLHQSQWPLMEDPQHTLYLNSVADNTYTTELSSTITPSISQLAYTHPAIASRDDGVITTSSLMLGLSSAALKPPRLGTTASQVKGHVTAPSQTRSTVPLHQASVATWKPASAKRKGPQSRIPLEARQILEDEFVANPYPCSWEMDIIAHQANLDVKKVRNWFNNTRARNKGGGKSFL